MNKSILDILNIYSFLYHNSIVYGWGRKKSFFKAQALAKKNGSKLLCLEDGFIRSLGLGKDGYNPLSLAVDQTGIYFDAFQTSDLEKLILQDENIEFNTRAQNAIHTIVSNQLTKYNQKFQCVDARKFSSKTKNVLVIDQTFGDQSIKYAGAEALTFKEMLKQAIKNHPEAVVWVKTHPDVLAEKAQGHFNLDDLNHPRIKVLTQNFNPIELLTYFDDVYVVSSQLGFEALMCGKKVHCFGVPWYAGWGLTLDHYAPIDILNGRRHVTRSLEHLFACAYFKYALYVSPITQECCELEDILDLLIPNIEFQKKLPKQIVAYGFSPWKRKFIADYLSFPHIQITFKKFRKPKKDQHILAWGKKAYLLKQKGYSHVMTVEDGFIRSIGLGASLIRPCSLVFDDVGIYYDATQPSRIEYLFNQIKSLTSAQVARANFLSSEIKRLEISKYNVGTQTHLVRPHESKKIILVVGQVEDDMSIQLGGIDIKTNLALLQKVRLNQPDAYIIYKPHPDVEAGLRVGKIDSEIAYCYADQINNEISINRLFTIIDEIHTISSLSGFEALIRGLKVYCYGLPFYAGWGLTMDQHRCSRRNNTLSLQQLIYVTLVEYPLYNLAHTAKMHIPLVNPEDVIQYISHQKSSHVNQSNTLRNMMAKCLQNLKFWKK